VNDALLTPSTLSQLQALVAHENRVLPVGNRTKPPLSACDEATLVSLRSLRGIVEYEPSEFTFTVQAGTPVAEICAALAEKRQYLPFDPLLVDAGATIGGTVAAGLSGPGRFRYGGIRDFLLGVRFLSGTGEMIHAGGKVVKNSAGFDIPKFLVGSMGRLGVLTELTFKVFPQPIATYSLVVHCQSHQQAVKRIARAALSRWELDAIDYRPDALAIYLRLAGPESANASIANELKSTWGSDVSDLDSPAEFWQSVRELSWSSRDALPVKVPTTLQQMLALVESLGAEWPGHLHASVAGNLLWIMLDSREHLAALDTQLRALELSGLVVRGPCDNPRLGKWDSQEIERSLQAALDPPGKFAPFSSTL
jgi:glycolate oxidase FAD binding subunit